MNVFGMGEEQLIQGLGVPLVAALVQWIKKLLNLAGIPRDLVTIVITLLLGIAYAGIVGASPGVGAGIGGLAALLFKGVSGVRALNDTK